MKRKSAAKKTSWWPKNVKKWKLFKNDKNLILKLRKQCLSLAGYFSRPIQVTCRWGALQVIYLAGNIWPRSAQKIRRKIDRKIEDSKKYVNSNRKQLEVRPAQYQPTSLDVFNMSWLSFYAEKNHGKENILMTTKQMWKNWKLKKL